MFFWLRFFYVLYTRFVFFIFGQTNGNKTYLEKKGGREKRGERITEMGEQLKRVLKTKLRK